jgi:hypothetical protein
MVGSINPCCNSFSYNLKKTNSKINQHPIFFVNKMKSGIFINSTILIICNENSKHSKDETKNSLSFNSLFLQWWLRLLIIMINDFLLIPLKCLVNSLPISFSRIARNESYSIYWFRNISCMVIFTRLINSSFNPLNWWVQIINDLWSLFMCISLSSCSQRMCLIQLWYHRF